MEISAAIDGAEEIAQHLGGLSTRLTRAIVTDALLEGGEPIRATAARLAPREPGAPDLADNIRIAAVRKRPEDDVRTFSVGIGVPRQFFYDYFQEFGTVDHGAHPFYRPALDTHAKQSIALIGAAFWRELAGRGLGRSVSAPSRPSAPSGGDLV
jgi:HK97 gp10 family phage protein